MDNAYDFAPASLAIDGETNCTVASAERSSCCALSRKTTEPVLAVDLGKMIEVNTVKVLIPEKISFTRLEIRLGVSNNIQKSTKCAENLHIEEFTGKWIEFKCENKIGAKWVMITIPESTTQLSICEIEAFGAPIRTDIEMLTTENIAQENCTNHYNLDQSTVRDLHSVDKVDILKLHNGYRRSVSGSNMFQIRWSDELAENARFFAKQCEYKHSVKALAKKIIDFNYGESIAAISATSERVDWDQVIYDWFVTKRFYDPVKNTCSGDCKPYRNIVFAETAEIGCGVAPCSDIFDGEETIKEAKLVFCQYREQDFKKDLPFLPGPACSSCGEKSIGCENRLCIHEAVTSKCNFITTTSAPAIVSTTQSTFETDLFDRSFPTDIMPTIDAFTVSNDVILKNHGGFIQNENFDKNTMYSENDILSWTIAVPGARGYELTIMDLDLDADCSDSVIFWDKNKDSELLALRSCDPKINRLKMTKETIYVTAEEILVVMSVKSHQSSRGGGFKLYYEAVLSEDKTTFTTPAPDLCKLLMPCGVGGVCTSFGNAQDFKCECKIGFKSVNDAHACVDIDECQIAATDDNTAQFYAVFYAYPELYDLAITGLN